jgi:hypothetical protein
MVTVTNFFERTRKDGTTFIALEISGGVELVQSNNSGKFYATLRKTSVPSTFDETIAKGLIGSQMKGDVVRVQVDPYDFIDKRTGEVMTLQHSYAYQPEGSVELIGQTQVLEMA